MQLKEYEYNKVSSQIKKGALCPQQRYAAFGKISAAILNDSPVTIAMAMLLLRASCPKPYGLASLM